MTCPNGQIDRALLAVVTVASFDFGEGHLSRIVLVLIVRD